jgi:hypothetical protein
MGDLEVEDTLLASGISIVDGRLVADGFGYGIFALRD